MPSVFLDTYHESDFENFSNLLSDPGVMLHVDGIKTEPQIQAPFERALGRSAHNADHIWAVRKNSDGTYAGHAALYVSDVCSDNEREILFYLTKENWGRGYATEVGKLMLALAIDNDEIHRAWATVDSDHTASVKTCEKIGMRFDRTGVDEDGDFLIFRYDCV